MNTFRKIENEKEMDRFMEAHGSDPYNTIHLVLFVIGIIGIICVVAGNIIYQPLLNSIN
jgi:hypothetical protein